MEKKRSSTLFVHSLPFSGCCYLALFTVAAPLMAVRHMAELCSVDRGLKYELCLLRGFHTIRNNYTGHYRRRAAANSVLNLDLLDWI